MFLDDKVFGISETLHRVSVIVSKVRTTFYLLVGFSQFLFVYTSDIFILDDKVFGISETLHLIPVIGSSPDYVLSSGRVFLIFDYTSEICILDDNIFRISETLHLVPVIGSKSPNYVLSSVRVLQFMFVYTSEICILDDKVFGIRTTFYLLVGFLQFMFVYTFEICILDDKLLRTFILGSSYRVLDRLTDISTGFLLMCPLIHVN